MEFVTCTASVSYKRSVLLEFLHELSDELYLLVLFTKNTFLFVSIFFTELCIFLYNSDRNNSSNTVE
jgi:hypothetical protein